MAAKDKTYALVVDSARRMPGKYEQLPRAIEHVTGARAAATRATALVRTATRDGVDTRTVDVIDVATKRSVMVCQGPAIRSYRSKRNARRSFAQCQVLQAAFKKALKAPKRRKR